MNENTNSTATGDILTISGLVKSYGPVKVLFGINMNLARGSVLGLVGENGAGKSTLMKCVSGHEKPDSGTIALNGSCYMVPQEFTLIPTLTVTENIFLGREPAFAGFLKRREMWLKASELLARIGADDIDPDCPAGELSVAGKQKAEIAKAFLGGASLLIFDEPTTVLNRSETETLFGIIRSFRASGGSVIYISHKLDEVREICDEIAVLRDGVLVSRTPSRELTSAGIAERMVGRPLSQVFPEKLPAPAADALPALEADCISDGSRVLEASFRLYPGEILGLAGLAGAGRTELAELICGARRMKSGTLKVFGSIVRFRSVADSMEAGVAYLSEDRQGTAVIKDFTIAENVTLSSLRRHCKGPFVDFGKRDAAASGLAGELRIRCAGINAPVSSLSGGNQQKVAIAKGLDPAPRIYIFDEPTRGVDVGARTEIYSIIRSLAEKGMAVLMISSDLEEIIGNCRRSLVMREGRIAGEVSGDDVAEKPIMLLASGAGHAENS